MDGLSPLHGFSFRTPFDLRRWWGKHTGEPRGPTPLREVGWLLASEGEKWQGEAGKSTKFDPVMTQVSKKPNLQAATPSFRERREEGGILGASTFLAVPSPGLISGVRCQWEHKRANLRVRNIPSVGVASALSLLST